MSWETNTRFLGLSWEMVLHASSGKFLRIESCYPESFGFWGIWNQGLPTQPHWFWIRMEVDHKDALLSSFKGSLWEDLWIRGGHRCGWGNKKMISMKTRALSPGTVKVTFLLSFIAGGVRLMPLVSWISILHPKVFVSNQPITGSSSCWVTSKYWLW